MQVITSKDNELIKSIKKLKEKKYRDAYNKYIIEGIPSYSETQKETFFYIFKIEGNNTKKYILTSYSGDWAKGEYKFCFDKYTEGKPSGQQPTGKQPQPAAQSSSQSTSQMAEEPGEQLGGGLKNTNISSNG